LRKAHAAFNVATALVYIEITLNMGAFWKRGFLDVIVYVLLTLALVGVNRGYFGNIYATIKRLRFGSLNKVKDNVFKGDKLSFEILKYYYERRISWTSIVTFILQAVAIVISGIVNLGPVIAKAFTGA
jgi:hypothetical protein